LEDAHSYSFEKYTNNSSVELPNVRFDNFPLHTLAGLYDFTAIGQMDFNGDITFTDNFYHCVFGVIFDWAKHAPNVYDWAKKTFNIPPNLLTFNNTNTIHSKREDLLYHRIAQPIHEQTKVTAQHINQAFNFQPLTFEAMKKMPHKSEQEFIRTIGVAYQSYADNYEHMKQYMHRACNQYLKEKQKVLNAKQNYDRIKQENEQLKIKIKQLNIENVNFKKKIMNSKTLNEPILTSEISQPPRARIREIELPSSLIESNIRGSISTSIQQHSSRSTTQTSSSSMKSTSESQQLTGPAAAAGDKQNVTAPSQLTSISSPKPIASEIQRERTTARHRDRVRTSELPVSSVKKSDSQKKKSKKQSKDSKDSKQLKKKKDKK
jgi:hypothetical protein